MTDTESKAAMRFTEFGYGWWHVEGFNNTMECRHCKSSFFFLSSFSKAFDGVKKPHHVSHLWSVDRSQCRDVELHKSSYFRCRNTDAYLPRCVEVLF